MAAARKALQKQQPRLDLKRLVFIDETSVSTTITRLYGRAPQGERLIQKVPHGNWKTITFVAALRQDRVTAPFVLEGPMNGEMFKAYVEQFLAPDVYKRQVQNQRRSSCAAPSYSTRYRKAKASKGLTGSFGDRSWPRKAII